MRHYFEYDINKNAANDRNSGYFYLSQSTILTFYRKSPNLMELYPLSPIAFLIKVGEIYYFEDKVLVIVESPNFYA